MRMLDCSRIWKNVFLFFPQKLLQRLTAQLISETINLFRFQQIMKQLQRWYEMSVFYTNEEVKQYTFSGDLKKYDDFDKIIRMLEEVSGIKISIKENCVVIGTK